MRSTFDTGDALFRASFSAWAKIVVGPKEQIGTPTSAYHLFLISDSESGKMREGERQA